MIMLISYPISRIAGDAFKSKRNRATKWHNLDIRGCKPTVPCEMYLSALKGLNTWLIYCVLHSTPPGLPEDFMLAPRVQPAVIEI
jgi:hypothetical protein